MLRISLHPKFHQKQNKNSHAIIKIASTIHHHDQKEREFIESERQAAAV
jgi:hypothetical protein